MLIFSTLRILWLGWVTDHYIEPVLHFHYYGFGWVSPISASFVYGAHIIMIASAVGVMLGWFYRISAVFLFISFTYVALIDITYYLNHYYFVSLVLFMLIFAPAHRSFSIDAFRRRVLKTARIPKFWIFQFQVLIAIVYTYAGLAKLNHAWLIEALPLKIWLPAADTIPILGPLFSWQLAPYLFSWGGMLYDCTIVWWLAWSRSRPIAFVSVIVFHALTGILFQIGVFPMVMIGATLIFFSASWHLRILNGIGRIFLPLHGYFPKGEHPSEPWEKNGSRPVPKMTLVLAAAFFAFQLIFPWRYVLYPGNVFWTEQGYRFSWRVMLMEKAGTATFYVKDAITGREGIVVNSEFLNPHQEKQMAMQPDLILQFAHFLHDHYTQIGMADPMVRAEVYVTLNARPSELILDPTVDLAKIEDGWGAKSWLLPLDP